MIGYVSHYRAKYWKMLEEQLLQTCLLFWGKTHYGRPQPVLGPAKAMRMQNNLAEAIDYLEALISEYPDLAVGYIEIMDIYATDLKDKENTTSIYNRGKANVRGREECQKLDEAYKFFMTD